MSLSYQRQIYSNLNKRNNFEFEFILTFKIQVAIFFFGIVINIIKIHDQKVLFKCLTEYRISISQANSERILKNLRKKTHQLICI